MAREFFGLTVIESSPRPSRSNDSFELFLFFIAFLWVGFSISPPIQKGQSPARYSALRMDHRMCVSPARIEFRVGAPAIQDLRICSITSWSSALIQLVGLTNHEIASPLLSWLCSGKMTVSDINRVKCHTKQRISSIISIAIADTYGDCLRTIPFPLWN